MKMKKFLSLYLIICMVMQILPVFASDNVQIENTDSYGTEYILNEQFGADDLGGFTRNFLSLGKVDSVEIPEDPGNYAFMFSAGQGYSNDAEYAILNVNGANFVEGKDLVIKTRIKLEGSAASTRAMFKYNKDAADTTEVSDYTGTFFNIMPANFSGWGTKANGDLTMTQFATTSTSFTNTWFNAEIRFADSENATMVIYDDNGGTTGVIPFYPTEDVTNGIENIFVRCHKDDKVYLDYIQILYEYEAEMTVGSKYGTYEPVTVTFDTQTGCEAFKNAVAIYDDEGNKVATQNTIDGENKVVTLKPVEGFDEGKTYIARLDKTKIPANYKVDVTERTFFVTDYILNEQFGADDLGGFNKNGTAVGLVDAVEIPECSGNYAFMFSAGQGYSNDAEYAILNVDGANFAEGKELVIKTRIKLVGSGVEGREPRAMFRFNRITEDAGTTEDVFFNIFAAKINGWAPNANGKLEVKDLLTTSESFTDTWFNAEIRFADSENATMVISDDNGVTTGVIPFYHTQDITNGIENIIIRCHKEDKVYFDYIQILYEYEAEMTVGSKYGTYEPVTVTFDTQTGCEAFKNAVAIYDDEGNKVATQNTINETNTVVTLKPVEGFKEGETFTVRLDKTKIPANYRVDVTERTFFVTDYILNEQFGADDLGGFTLNSGAAGSLEPVEVPGETGNYAIELTSGAGYSNDAEYAILNIDGANFVEGKDLVIKTRIKFVGGGESTQRAIFRYNRVSGDASNSKGLIFNIVSTGLSSWAPHATSGDVGVRALTTTSTTFTDTWFNAEIRFADSENSTMVIYDDNGGTTGVIPFYPTSDITTGIENVFIKGHRGDKVYLDYVQILYGYETEMAVESKYASNQPIVVNFNTETGHEAFKDAVAIYDRVGNKVATQNTINEENKVVTLTPVNGLVDEATYTVRLDKTKIPANYIISETVKQFIVSDYEYILNKQFGANDLGGFELNSGATGTLKTIEVPGEIGNYAVELTSGGGYSNDAEYAILNVDSANFVEGKDLVIKTRIKFVGGGESTQRAIFRYNRVSGDASNSKGLIFNIVSTGLSGWAPNASGVVDVRPLTQTTSTTFTDTWFNAEIRFADSENGTMVIYDDNGGTTGVIPFYPTSDITTGIENVFIKGHRGDKVYLDYVQMFYGYETEMTVGSKYGTSEPITVTFDTKAGNEAFKNAVAIYDNDGNKIATQNTIDEENKIVTLTPVNALENEKTYTVRFDKTAISGNYIIDEPIKQFFVSDYDYILNEQFGANDLGGFTLNATAAGTLKSAEIADEIGNYAVEFSSGAGYWDDKEYAVLNTDGADYAEGKELVINTRIKLVGSGVENRAPRAVFKYNKEVSDTTEAEDNTNLFFIMSASGLAGWAYDDEGILAARTLNTTSTNLVDIWVNAEIRIVDSENATMIVTDENGGTTGIIPLYYSADIKTGIENIFVRSHKEDKVYIDYITIKQVDRTIRIETEASAELKVNGEASSVIKAGDSVVPEFTLRGEPGTTFIAISAMYVDGVLEDTHIKTLTAENAQRFSYTEADGYTVPQTGDVVIKAFVWNSLDSLVPISDVAKASDDTLTVYVQTYGDNNEGTGEKYSPVATLGKALSVAKEKYNANPDAYSKTEIVIGDGIYNVGSTISINENTTSFGEEGLVIKAEDEAKPAFVGGITYNVKDAEKVNDPEILSRLHNNDAKNNLYELNLTTQIAVADIPAVSYPGSHTINKMLSQEGVETAPEVTCEALFDNNLMTVARYPNSGYENMGEIVDAGVAGVYMLPEYVGTDEYVALSQENLLKGFEFKTDYTNLSNWATADQALIFGYFKHDWATQTVPLKNIDAKNGTIRSKYPSYYGVAVGKRYYVYNLLEEIDLPGEYFIERKGENAGKMYFYMPENETDNSTISITCNNGSLISVNGVENVTIEGITVTGSKSSGVYLDGNNNTIKDCEISNTASYGINVRGTNNTVDNCFIHDTNIGVFLEGGVTETLISANNKVQNCEITRFSRLNKTYSAAVDIYGVGNIVTHNEIYDGEHLALRYVGQNHEISYNEVYNVCKEVDDGGALYVGRTWTSRGNKIISNYFHDIKSDIDGEWPIAALYFDDHFAGAYVEGNVFADITGYGIFGNGGREHTIKNNVFVNCTKSSTRMDDSNPDKDYSTQFNGLNDVPYTSEIWKTAFPGLYSILDNYPKYPVYHIYRENLSVGCGGDYLYGELATNYVKEEGDISNNYDTADDPGFADMAEKDYTITTETLAVEIPGFKTIEFSKMGRQ